RFLSCPTRRTSDLQLPLVCAEHAEQLRERDEPRLLALPVCGTAGLGDVRRATQVEAMARFEQHHHAAEQPGAFGPLRAMCTEQLGDIAVPGRPAAIDPPADGGEQLPG